MMIQHEISMDTRIIYKYELEPHITRIRGCFTKLVHLGEQHGKVMVWLEKRLTKLDFVSGKQIPMEDVDEKEYEFIIVGTGWPYTPSDIGEHVGTVQMSDGLVWHIFVKEVKENDNS